VIAAALAAGVVLGAAAFYAIDRVRFLWGATIRDMRHAGWTARRRTP
jgi:hypothetical protein